LLQRGLHQARRGWFLRYRGVPATSRDGLRVIRGDVRDPLAVLRLAGQDAVVSAVGAAPATASPDYSVYRDAAQALDELEQPDAIGWRMTDAY
jgi:putative NADH-flavin reductase